MIGIDAKERIQMDDGRWRTLKGFVMLFDRESLKHMSFERMQQPRLPIVPLRERYKREKLLAVAQTVLWCEGRPTERA
ncbi:hypothetical protein [Roseibium sp.]|uniref:hypothetical protein n=1 Tax=Roseibium sp. TaxID=1936156 RepID=UPI001B19785F|nr:hypothetical protein [Roseibium sp.]MBO6855633.1 hypothetical protein [Roseibium sp.]